MSDLDYLKAAEELAAARVRYAEEFLRFKATGASDGQAHQQAILSTSAEITILEAKLVVREMW